MKISRKNIRKQITANLKNDAARPQWKSTDKPVRSVVLLGA